MLPNYLYHGTSLARFKSILQDGSIHPRAVVGWGSWEGYQESRGDTVYLTSAYPLYYAQAAVGESTDSSIVLEVDTRCLEEVDFIADEDVLKLWMQDSIAGSAWQGGGSAWHTQEAVKDRRVESHLVSGERSLAALGSCGYLGSIPLHCISRWLAIPRKAVSTLVITGMDPVINLKSYALLGSDYEDAVQWLFRNNLVDMGCLARDPELEKLMPSPYKLTWAELGLTLEDNPTYKRR